VTSSTRIALIHATRLAIDPIVNAFHKYWPEAEPVSLLDETLSIDRSKDDHLTDELSDRIIKLNGHAESFGAAGILFTCSAFGEAIEIAAAVTEIPVLKPNEAMFEKAFSLGERVAMVYTFPPAVAGMEQEFNDEANARSSKATVRSVFAEGARDAVERGDIKAHNQIICDTVSRVKDADVILLAHFSMATAASDASKVTDIPVLSSPETAVVKIKSLIATSGNKKPC